MQRHVANIEVLGCARARSRTLGSAELGSAWPVYFDVCENCTNRSEDASPTESTTAFRVRRGAAQKIFFLIWRDHDDEVEALRRNLFERPAAKYFDILLGGALRMASRCLKRRGRATRVRRGSRKLDAASATGAPRIAQLAPAGKTY